jgi:hypothetical protein
VLARPLVAIGGFTQPATPGRPYLDQKAIQGNATAGNATLTAAQILQGILNRTGPGGGFTDTWPNADDISSLRWKIPQKGDSWLTYLS